MDAAMDGDCIRAAVADADERSGKDGTLDPDAIAATHLALHRQPRSVWTQEVDLRPFREPS
jgi:hypothetical protein